MTRLSILSIAFIAVCIIEVHGSEPSVNRPNSDVSTSRIGRGAVVYDSDTDDESSGGGVDQPDLEMRVGNPRYRAQTEPPATGGRARGSIRRPRTHTYYATPTRFGRPATGTRVNAGDPPPPPPPPIFTRQRSFVYHPGRQPRQNEAPAQSIQC